MARLNIYTGDVEVMEEVDPFTVTIHDGFLYWGDQDYIDNKYVDVYFKLELNGNNIEEIK